MFSTTELYTYRYWTDRTRPFVLLSFRLKKMHRLVKFINYLLMNAETACVRNQTVGNGLLMYATKANTRLDGWRHGKY
jgi:hypothetical protein